MKTLEELKTRLEKVDSEIEKFRGLLEDGQETGVGGFQYEYTGKPRKALESVLTELELEWDTLDLLIGTWQTPEELMKEFISLMNQEAPDTERIAELRNEIIGRMVR